MTDRSAILTRIAEELAEAERLVRPLPPLSRTYPWLSVADAYRVQDASAAARVRAGDPIRGYKVGLTSRAMQQMMGVDQPDSGYLFASQLLSDNEEVPVSSLCVPRVEFEIAFVLGKELSGPGCTAAQVLWATELVAPAIEIVDSRIKDFEVTLEDSIADNASGARAVLGTAMAPSQVGDLRLVGTVARINGAVVATGAGGAVLGDPAAAVAWLVNRLAAEGTGLRPGMIVLPGSCTRAFDVAAGDVVRAEFRRLGHVTVRFGQ